jgi:hypothetical protein
MDVSSIQPENETRREAAGRVSTRPSHRRVVGDAVAFTSSARTLGRREVSPPAASRSPARLETQTEAQATEGPVKASRQALKEGGLITGYGGLTGWAGCPGGVWAGAG